MANDTIKKIVTAVAVGATVTYVGTGLWDKGVVYTQEVQPTLGEGCQPPGVICELPCAVRGETESRSCLACHDGTIGVSVNFSGGIPGGYDFGHLDQNHPVDVSIYTANTGARIKPIIDSRLVLVGGQLVGCTTCHNYWAMNQESGWPAVPKAELCNGCHDM